jgi:hypothetical protein
MPQCPVLPVIGSDMFLIICKTEIKKTAKYTIQVLIHEYTYGWNGDSEVSIVTRLRVGRSRVQFPVEAGEFCLL